ncbi:uncharacterized protein M421DRAFT_420326 [Didymella exigua CBS 183.55]|uniref:Non-haem dioxygenase N-terminal domain-containing protein n=1 Tax=Didymella exigua CBS 183.55 TaxID=1150837 RepID=A0A6A5RMV9_9PLEO|nr:uncharacterized protein M421DRAFT_420326 [Didymella exigua CBS 183.55]KAF1929102.1 hypothetical protein M421DRAFT_420326 [Didymella exigua CBS 183.55]
MHNSSAVDAIADIQIIDFSTHSSPDSQQDKIATATETDNAFQSKGFLYLQNHDVRKQRVDEWFAWVWYHS